MCRQGGGSLPRITWCVWYMRCTLDVAEAILMNADILAGKWKQLRGRAKEQWADLTDDDLTKAEGSYDKLVGTIQARYGYARDRAKAEVDAWMNGIPDVR